MLRRLVPIQLGRLKYSAALNIQHYYADLHLQYISGKSKSPAENVLLCVEHDPVYTIGLRTDGYTIRDEQKLRSLGAEFEKTNRGGLITFHGPGQLVVYPIIHLKEFKFGMREYIGKLEQSVISMCSEFGLTGETSPHTGVWIQEKKLAAIGVHGSRFVTTHGIGINCNTDLSWFDHIVPCGIEEKGVTSLTEQLDRPVTTTEALDPLLKAFSQHFDCDVTPIRPWL